MPTLELVPFVALDPEVARRAIEGYQNELEPELRVQEAFYRQFRCVRCGSGYRKEFAAGHVFSDAGSLLPRALLRCERCGFLLDPHSGLVVERGQSFGG
jgi:rubredoxin